VGGTPGDPGTPISVALASFNGAGFIAARWDSFAAQTRLPDELVVCDDVSSAIWIIAACTSFACTGGRKGQARRHRGRNADGSIATGMARFV
jgi:hypothetical protein